MTTLYRCPNPTDRLCACGRAARSLKQHGIDFDEVRVPYSRRDRPEVEELTSQRYVPVLVLGEDVITDSHRIREHLEWLAERAAAPLDRGEG